MKNKIAKTPLVMQMEATECGAACLTMILAYYRKWVPLEQIRFDCGVSRDGANAKNVVVTARKYGLEAKGYHYSMQSLLEKAVFPCVIYWNYNHFMVLNGIRRNRAYVNDPSKGNYSMPLSDFERGYSGVCLCFSPGPDFEPGGKPQSVLVFAAKKLGGRKKDMLFLVGTTILTSVLGMLLPGFSRAYVDTILGSGQPDWLRYFMVLFLFVVLLKFFAQALSLLFSLRINGKLDLIGNAEYMWHVYRLPVSFFDNRVAGDIAQRKEENAEVYKTLVNTLAPLLIKAFLIVVYLVLLIRYNLWLAMAGVLSVALKLWASWFISNKRINIARVQKRDYGILSASTLTGIHTIETLKASGAEEGYFRKWAGYQAGNNAQNQKYATYDSYLSLIPEAVGHVCDTIVLGGGILLVLNGFWTLGIISAFQGILSMFMSPANDFISAIQTVQEMRTDMERIEDVMNSREDNLEESLDEGEEIRKLSGQISLKDLTFGYSALAAPLISGFSLEIRPGSSIAVVGASGSGKSTLTRLITGLYEPWSGSITFDGKPIHQINHYVFTGSVAAVDQEIHLFAGTFAENIRFGNPSLEDYDLILAARDACIHDEIMMMDYGYQEKLQPDGRNLSGGQRQRIEIATALARDPAILIMDEATSALDAKTEYEVMKRIHARGITTIIIAHRLSTIRDSDQIIVLDQGKVVETGTHQELVKKQGYYYRLVKNG